MNPMQMFQQFMKAPNKQMMVQSLLSQNPQLNNAWQMAQQLGQNSNKQAVIQQIAKQKGISTDEVIKMAKELGINIQ